MPASHGMKRKRAAPTDGASRTSSSYFSKQATTSVAVPADRNKKSVATSRRPTLKQGQSSVVTSELVWPFYFKELERVYKALNLVYTFCCTRRHLATTFEILKSAVEKHTKKELTVYEIAQIKFLLPKSIHFEYVDEDALQLHITRSSSRDQVCADGSEKGVKQVLLFEFVDGDPKRLATKRLGEASVPAYRRPQDEYLKVPTFSIAQMTKLIEKRNSKFMSAVNLFLRECTEGSVDPVESIKSQFHLHAPAPIYLNSATPEPSMLPPEIPNKRKSIPEIIEEVKASSLYANQIVANGHRMFPPQDPIYGNLSFLLSQTLVNAVYTARDITRLYSHQAEAINNLLAGHHAIISTSTSSGKSLIYQVPVLHELEHDRSTRAIFIFPTKALAQDQRRSLLEILVYMTETLRGVVVDTFDGDTPKEDRRRIREEASVIFTNPGS